MLNAEQDKRISIYQTYSVFVTLFSKPIKEGKLYYLRKLSRVFSVAGFRFEEK